MGIVLVPNQMHLGPFLLLSLIVMRVEDFSEMFIWEGCSNSEGKNGTGESVGRDLAVAAAVPWAGDLLMGTSPGRGLSPRKGFD